MSVRPIRPTPSKPSKPPTPRGSGLGPSSPAQEQARRRRLAARRQQRFESVLARLPRPGALQLPWQGLTVPAALHPTPWHFSKALSALLLVGALTALTLLHTQEQWFLYREDVRFANLIRLRADDLYAQLNVDGFNIFWVEPEQLRTALLGVPWVKEAKVEIGLPAALSVEIAESMPVALWVTNAGNYWVDATGAAMPVVELAESALPELALPQIVDSLQEARAIGDGPLAIDKEILTSALALVEALPELEGKVRYNQSVGLNFPLPEPAVWVYWGDGVDLDAKLVNLNATRRLVRSSEEPAQILDLRFEARPYVR